MPKAPPELAVIEKTQELLVWTLKHIEKFPRTHRFGFRVVFSSVGVSTSPVAEIARRPPPEPVGSRTVRACRCAVHRAAPCRVRLRTWPKDGRRREVWYVRRRPSRLAASL